MLLLIEVCAAANHTSHNTQARTGTPRRLGPAARRMCCGTAAVLVCRSMHAAQPATRCSLRRWRTWALCRGWHSTPVAAVARRSAHMAQLPRITWQWRLVRQTEFARIEQCCAQVLEGRRWRRVFAAKREDPQPAGRHAGCHVAARLVHRQLGAPVLAVVTSDRRRALVALRA